MIQLVGYTGFKPVTPRLKDASGMSLSAESSNSSYLFVGDLASDDGIICAYNLEKLDYYYKGGQKCGMLRSVTYAATAW
jgi:hypothetical protein